MIKRLLFLSLVFIVGLSPQCFSMWGNDIFENPELLRAMGKLADDAFRDSTDTVQRLKEQREIELRHQLHELDEDRKKASSDEERLEITKQKSLLMQNAVKVQDRWEEVGASMAGVMPNMLNTVTEMAKERQNAESKLEQTAIESEAKKEAAIENTKQYIKALKDPKNAKLLALTASAIAVGICGAWHGTKLLSSLIQQYMHKIPTISEETSLVSVKDKLVNYFTGSKLESNINEVILEKNLAARVLRIATSVKNTVSNAGFFRHLLFYGPPGTGKTMLAKRIARSSGLEYIYFAGGSALEQLEIEDALSKLTELFEFAKRSPKKLMIIIDEAEVLLADRNKKLSDKTRKLLNLVLGYTGTEQKNFVVVALTNRPEDLDKAFLSRCDERIEVGVPAPAERLGILELYVNKFLVSRMANQARPSFFSGLFGAKVAPKGLTIEKDALSKDSLVAIAEKLDGFVGRDISKLVIAIQSEAYASPKGCITKDMVHEIVQQKIDQKIAEERDFKRSIDN